MLPSVLVLARARPWCPDTATLGGGTRPRAAGVRAGWHTDDCASRSHAVLATDARCDCDQGSTGAGNAGRCARGTPRSTPTAPGGWNESRSCRGPRGVWSREGTRGQPAQQLQEEIAVLPAVADPEHLPRARVQRAGQVVFLILAGGQY